MLGRESDIIVIGDNNILHLGLFHLIEVECERRNTTALILDHNRDFWLAIPSESTKMCRFAILCLGYEDFFPTWFSTFLTLIMKTNGNVLIFTDSHALLNKRKRNLLSRVCEVEHVLDASMPVSYISYLIDYHISRKCTVPRDFKISMRELTVLDGFLNGVDPVCHSSWMGITPKTLYQHRKNCANKLGVRNLKDLLRI